ncbi:MAG: hypothetical protein CVV05_15470 [Gammaproteobacteria bacterium HGW-Gammaproteobacteria-1]|nr:MAG: hypothetical protein CVV05_15470 [Gammaproteobacteria bacterium HGW-Gammaproteobacteria-1]
MEYHQTMWAEMKPDVYDGENCDQVRPRWHAHAEGDMDSDYTETVTLDSKQFPPGTKILVMEPCCPKCGMIPDLCRTDEGCDFDWDAWTLDQYS